MSSSSNRMSACSIVRPGESFDAIGSWISLCLVCMFGGIRCAGHAKIEVCCLPLHINHWLDSLCTINCIRSSMVHQITNATSPWTSYEEQWNVLTTQKSRSKHEHTPVDCLCFRERKHAAMIFQHRRLVASRHTQGQHRPLIVTVRFSHGSLWQPRNTYRQSVSTTVQLIPSVQNIINCAGQRLQRRLFWWDLNATPFCACVSTQESDFMCPTWTDPLRIVLRGQTTVL